MNLTSGDSLEDLSSDPVSKLVRVKVYLWV